MDSRLAWQVIDGEAVVVDLGRGRTLGLNPTASFIWSLIPDHDEPAIAEALCRRFEIDVDTARAEVHEFLQGLLDRGLVTDAG
jgi:hypothetical protein